MWRHVVRRPESFRRWNDKVSGLDAVGEFRVGQPFTTHYLWHGKALQCASIATEIHEGRVLELRHTAPVGPGVPSRSAQAAVRSGAVPLTTVARARIIAAITRRGR